MIRHESIITALIGTALGMVLGILLAVVVTQALADEGLVFSVPVVSLIVFVIVAIIAGMSRPSSRRAPPAERAGGLAIRIAPRAPFARNGGPRRQRYRASLSGLIGRPARSSVGAGYIRSLRFLHAFALRVVHGVADDFAPDRLALDGGHDRRPGSGVLSIFARPSVLPPRAETDRGDEPDLAAVDRGGAPLAASPPPSRTTLVSQRRCVAVAKASVAPWKPLSRSTDQPGRTRRARRSRRTRRRR